MTDRSSPLDWDARDARPAFAGHTRIDIPWTASIPDPGFGARLTAELTRTWVRGNELPHPATFIAADIAETRTRELVLTLLIAPTTAARDTEAMWPSLLAALERARRS